MTHFAFHRPPVAVGSALPERAVDRVRSLYEELERTQWLSSAEIEAQQLQKIRALLEHCRQHVPYYGRRWQESGLNPAEIQSLTDFRKLPVITREEWQQNACELTATQLPPGVCLTGSGSTSGSSGVPVEVQQTNVGSHWWWACHLRDLQWSNIDPRGDLAVIRCATGTPSPAEMRSFLLGISIPRWFPDFPDLLQTGYSHGMDIRQTPERQLAWLQRISPDYLVSYPSNLDLLADLVRNAGVRFPRLRVIQTVSETLRDDERERIEAAFGVPVKSLYSCTEAGYVASPCPTGHGFHVHAEHVLVEVLNAAGQPCMPGETGSVVLTALNNFASPFIRYEIQDEVTVASQPCPCGRGLPLLQSIQGKNRPGFHLTDGRIKPTCELASELQIIGGHRQHQIIQRTLNHVTVRISPNSGWSDGHAQRIVDVVQQYLEHRVTVDIQLVDRIAPAPSGKIDNIICEVPAQPVRREIVPAPHFTSSRDGELAGKTVLLAWELGNGLGHVQKLVPVARALAKHGLRIVFAAREPKQAGSLLEGLGFEVLQAPDFAASASQRVGFVTSYGDILGRLGFDSAEKLGSMVQAWQTILDHVRPDLIVCDHSPTLCLTAAGAIPTVVVGNGFCVPPTRFPQFPKLLPDQPLEYPESELLAVIQSIQRQRQRPVPTTLPGLFAEASCFVTAFPEMDPYLDERTEPVVGPLEPVGTAAVPPEVKSYFAYLDADHPGVDRILTGLSLSGYPGRAYLRNVSAQQREEWQRPGLEILTRPLPLPDVLPQVSVIIHHASGGTAQHALAVGRPQLVFPTHLEQALNGQMLHALGVAHYALQVPSPELTALQVRELIENPGYADRAWDRACTLQLVSSGGLPTVVSHCFSLLKQSLVPTL